MDDKTDFFSAETGKGEETKERLHSSDDERPLKKGERTTVKISRDEHVPLQNEPLIAERYRVLEELGRGNMGLVYKVEDTNQDDRVLALKMSLFPSSASDPGLGRFRREIEIMLRLRHPNIVRIYDAGEDHRRLFFVMDYVEGRSLYSLIAKKEISLSRSIEIVAQIAAAADYAHKQGIVHRDLKPANIMIDANGQAILMDFGIAKVMEESTHLTRSGTTIGTPYYMSPEQTRGDRELDGRSDIFSLGAMLYEMTTGCQAFDEESMSEILRAILHKHPLAPTIHNPAIPLPIEAVCLKALEKEREMRYTTAGEMARDLQQYMEQQQMVVKRTSPLWNKIRKNWKLLVANSVFLTVLALVFWLLLRQ